MRKQILVPALVGFALVLTGCSSDDIDEDGGVSIDSSGGNIEAPSDDSATSEGSGGTVALSDDREYPTDGCRKAASEANATFEQQPVVSEEYEENTLYPLYGDCRSPGDLMAALKIYPGVMGGTSAAYIDRYVLEAFCFQKAAERACRGYQQALEDY